MTAALAVLLGSLDLVAVVTDFENLAAAAESASFGHVAAPGSIGRMVVEVELADLAELGYPTDTGATCETVDSRFACIVVVAASYVVALVAYDTVDLIEFGLAFEFAAEVEPSADQLVAAHTGTVAVVR